MNGLFLAPQFGESGLIMYDTFGPLVVFSFFCMLSDNTAMCFLFSKKALPTSGVRLKNKVFLFLTELLHV